MMARPATGMPSLPVQAEAKPPQRFYLGGRSAQFENSDINGEYSFVGDHLGFPAYHNRTNGIAIRFQLDRWLIDRDGLRDSDVCAGYAVALPHCRHPACPDLVWHIWDSRAQSFVKDEEVFTIDAPKEAVFIGRGDGQENGLVGGKYTLSGIANSRGYYRHQTEDLTVYYRPQEKRWAVSHNPDLGSDLCLAWATAGTSIHPVDASLEWNFWVTDANNFFVDPRAGFSNAPMVINILGRHQEAENSRINGEYQLCGLYEGKPLYYQPGAGFIKYSPTKDMWLIDCDGLSAQPGLMSRLMTFITGDSDSEHNRCNAFAPAHGTEHPGHSSLQWYAWDSVGQRHHLDKNIVSIRYPVRVQVNGRDARLENADINGVYELTKFYEERPVYEKPGQSLSMYFSRPLSTWVIDRHGVSDNGVFVALMDGQKCSEDPTVNSAWKVHECSRNFVVDKSVSVIAPANVPPGYTASCDQSDAFLGEVPPTNAACHGMKRGYADDTQFASLAQSPQPKHARGAGQGGGWLHDASRRVFGA